MGCPAEVEIGDNLVFTVTTHLASSGALTDADAVPAYRVYEDETGTAILTGNMAKLDDANTTGFYSESLACTSGNGFENGKSYSVYISAAVSSVTGAISYGFKAYDQRKVNVTQVSGDATAADNLELDYDGTGYNKSNSTIGTTTTNTDMRGTDSAFLAASAPTNFGDLSITATTGRVDLAAVAGTAQTAGDLAALITALNDPTAAAVADAVWDEARSGHTTQGTYGESFKAQVSGNATATTLTTTTMSTDLTEATDNHYIGRVIVWTTGALLNQASRITDYDGTTKTLTFTETTEAPSSGDDFIIF